jgi:hypothetical protein
MEEGKKGRTIFPYKVKPKNKSPKDLRKKIKIIIQEMLPESKNIKLQIEIAHLVHNTKDEIQTTLL